MKTPLLKLEEKHELEQYFWDEQTLDLLCDVVSAYKNPCALCAPMLGVAMAARGQPISFLDTDERFGHVPGFRKWDAYRPEHINEEFDLIICDPPFFSLSLSQLFTAIRLLAGFRLSTPLAIGYLERRENSVLGTFAPFNLEQSPFYPSYKTVQKVERNIIRFYANFDLPERPLA